MNWKKEAMEKLGDYDAKRNALSSIPAEIKRLELSATSIRSSTSDSSPVKGGGSVYEDRILSNIAHRQELERSLAEAKAWVDMVDKGLAVLTAQERKILDRFYIHPAKGNVDRLCEELACERSQVYRRKDDALRHFTIALYGRTES